MPKRTNQTRLNPSYLAGRHAGTVFFFVALGLALGLLWRALFEPTGYRAEARTDLTLVPAGAAPRFDWDGALRDWRGLLDDPRETALLDNNLRYLLKLSFSDGMLLDTETFPEATGAFDTPQEYSASLFANPLIALVGPSMTVTRRDLAANIDYQSLAAIIRDLDPPAGEQGWDFSTGPTGADSGPGAGMVTHPGSDDHHFGVFYRLYEIVNSGLRPASPEAAWRFAVDTLNARLEREARFSGGGGFGHVAKRELLREIVALPVLAANGLYQTGLWSYGDGDFSGQGVFRRGFWSHNVELAATHRGDAGQLTVAAREDLHPVIRPRDTVLTRIQPLAVLTVIGHLAALEARNDIAHATPRTQTDASLPAEENAPQPIAVAVQPVPDNGAAAEEEEERKRRRERLTLLEQSLSMARLECDSAQSRLETARDAGKKLTLEAIAARARADRLNEQYSTARAEQERDRQPAVPPEIARVLKDRDAVVKRLTGLLQRCTEEHPFVRQARRELETLDAQLANHVPDPAEAAAAEARATRLASLYVELESALALATDLETKSSRQDEAVTCLLREVAEAEKKSAGLEREMTVVRSTVPARREQVTVQTHVLPVPAPVVAPRREVAPESPPRLVFSTLPARIPLFKTNASWLAPLLGAIVGLCLGLGWMAVKEIFASRFADASAAARLLPYPILAVLPAYDARTFRTAAASLRGDLSKSGRPRFIPSPVDASEPPPAGRRDRVFSARSRRRLLPWVAGTLILAAAVALSMFVLPGLSRAGSAFPDELRLPASMTYGIFDSDGEEEEWRDLP